ncbi:MAG TPA: rod shape-determining protein MreC [Bryobacteraceae bacterium]|nr:rod shape-determining protein MreC [Bryobacteraceae bacterium]
MDFFLSRYRNLTVLLIVIVAQLLLLAYQVKSNNNVALIRVWAVTAVTPVEQGLELVRRYTWGFVEDYFVLLGVRSQNEKLQHENGQLKLENHYLKAELSTADRAQALSVFQAHSPSKTVAARVIGNGTGANSKVVFVDRGAVSGIENGMAVVTPDGIVGKVVDAYPMASLVMLITDPTFAAGVISQKNHVRGTLKGLGQTKCLVDYAQNEEKVDEGEWFYTSGDDRIFPRGFPVGQVSSVRNGKTFKEIYLVPSGMQGGVEEVLIMLQGQHLQIPDSATASSGYKILAAPNDAPGEPVQPTGQSTVLTTDADRLREQYKQSGEAQHHVFGEGLPGSAPPDFTKIQGVRATAPAARPPETATQPNREREAAQPKPVTPPAATPVETPAKAAAATAPPKPKPRPTAPILVTDPTDADPDAPPPAPKTDKPAKPPGGAQPPSGNP